MKYCDDLTRTYKSIQDRSMRVFLETFDEYTWFVTSQDTLQTINRFNTQEDAFDFCRFLGLNVSAIVRHKNK